MYDERFFYTGQRQPIDDAADDSEFIITQEDLNIVNSLKSRIFEFGYYNQMVTWSTKDNPGISVEKLNRSYVVMQFLTMTAEVKPEILKELNLESHHIKLLRGLYLEFGPWCPAPVEPYNFAYADDSTKKDYIISMGYKRPFGNSYILGDVIEYMGEYGERDKLEEKASIVLDEFAVFIDRFFRDGYILKYNDLIFTSWKKENINVIPWNKLGINFNPLEKATTKSCRTQRKQKYSLASCSIFGFQVPLLNLSTFDVSKLV